MILRTPSPTLFPYTTLFRSVLMIWVLRFTLRIREHPALMSKAPELISSSRTNDMRAEVEIRDRKSTRLNSSHVSISYAVFCLKKKINNSKQLQHLYQDHEIS